jgi:hypothetical protein
MELKNLVCLVGVVTALVACGKTETKVESTPANAPAAAASAAPSSSSTKLGIDLYPGMEALMEGRRIAGDKSGYAINSAYKSADKPDKVAAFFREQFTKKYGPTGLMEMPSGEGMVRLIGGSEEANQRYDLTIRAEGDGTVVGIIQYIKN